MSWLNWFRRRVEQKQPESSPQHDYVMPPEKQDFWTCDDCGVVDSFYEPMLWADHKCWATNIPRVGAQRRLRQMDANEVTIFLATSGRREVRLDYSSTWVKNPEEAI